MGNLSIMFSGGLDSLIASAYAYENEFHPDCFFVDMGQSNAEKEWDAIGKISHLVPYEVIRLEMTDLVPLLSAKMSNQIVPSRNLFLAVIGSMFNERVWINALDGEQNGKEHDKSLKFFQDSTKLLSFTNSFFQDSTIIESPFSHMSKAETIKWALKQDFDPEDLYKTTSCYDGKESKCGECLTCYKRYTAFLLNGLEEPGYTKNPLDSEYAKELDDEMAKAITSGDYTRFTYKRAEEWIKLKEII